jgi:hypothetical protein
MGGPGLYPFEPHIDDLYKKLLPFPGCQAQPYFFRTSHAAGFVSSSFRPASAAEIRGVGIIQGSRLEPCMQRKPAFVHKSAAGKGKLPPAERASVLIPAGDGVIPGVAATGAGKAMGPADTEQGVCIGFFIHGTDHTPKIGLCRFCNNLTNGKMDEISCFFTGF